VSSEYCAIPLPAVVLARDGEAMLIRRRLDETELASPFLLPPARSRDASVPATG